MSIDEKIVGHLPDECHERCQPIIADLMAAFAQAGAAVVTDTLVRKAVAIEAEFDRNLDELNKLL